MSAARERTQADYDLDRIIDCLDEAIMSTDPRVQECLRRLMVTVALIQPEGRREDTRQGPLRQMMSDMRDINNRLHTLESQVNRTIGNTIDQWMHQYPQKFYTAPTTTMPPTQVTWTAGDPLPGSNWTQGTAVDPLTKRTL